MESKETQNETCVVEYTDQERTIALRHHVEPKLVRLLDEIVEKMFDEQMRHYSLTEAFVKAEAHKQSQKAKEQPEAEKIEKPDKSDGEQGLWFIKKWLSARSYTEKLTAVLLWQLVGIESLYDKPDDCIGNDFYRRFEGDVINASTKTPIEESAITAFTIALMPVKV